MPQGSSQQVDAAHGAGAAHEVWQVGAHESLQRFGLSEANRAFKRSSRLARPHGSQSFFAQPAKIGVPQGVHELLLSLALMRASRPGLPHGSHDDEQADPQGSQLTANAEIRRAAETFMDGVPSRVKKPSLRKSTDSREE